MTLYRRRFLQASLSLGAVSLLGCGPALRDLTLANLPAALDEMRRLGLAPALQSSTEWSWSQTLVHLAQSIEYAMTGYPQQHSPLFQTMVGQPALAYFRWRGQMRHSLNEPIPGSPPMAPDTPLDAAAQRLLVACHEFMQWDQPLHPHFAYGPLTHADYEQAHAMHMANHFAAFRKA